MRRMLVMAVGVVVAFFAACFSATSRAGDVRELANPFPEQPEVVLVNPFPDRGLELASPFPDGPELARANPFPDPRPEQQLANPFPEPAADAVAGDAGFDGARAPFPCASGGIVSGGGGLGCRCRL